MQPLSLLRALPLLLLALTHCTSHVEGGGSSTCPAPTPGQCLPSQTCDDGLQQNGEATCQDGEWVCTTVPCTSACVNPTPSCSDGQITSFCCPAGDPCADPPPFCDLGDGTCAIGACPTDADAGAPCSAGSIVAASYDQSCASDSDCTAIYAGDLCSSCFCPTAAINQGGLAAYQAAFAAAQTGPGDCECPEFPPPVCNAGQCVLP